MKYCKKCDSSKDIKFFNKNSSSKDGLQTQCRDCSRKNGSVGYKNNPERRKAIKDRNAKVVKYNRRFVSRYKRLCGCYVCREKEPAVLDLHHKDPATKDGDPATMLGYSTKRLKEEIRKCMVLCANCHRKFHAGLLML
jgi:hypothetical protein